MPALDKILKFRKGQLNWHEEENLLYILGSIFGILVLTGRLGGCSQLICRRAQWCHFLRTAELPPGSGAEKQLLWNGRNRQGHQLCGSGFSARPSGNEMYKYQRRALDCPVLNQEDASISLPVSRSPICLATYLADTRYNRERRHLVQRTALFCAQLYPEPATNSTHSGRSRSEAARHLSF